MFLGEYSDRYLIFCYNAVLLIYNDVFHIYRDDCLQCFKHVDIVTGVAFHPTHDRYFVSSCFDRRIRIWDIIPDGTVKEWCLVSIVLLPYVMYFHMNEMIRPLM